MGVLAEVEVLVDVSPHTASYHNSNKIFYRTRSKSHGENWQMSNARGPSFDDPIPILNGKQIVKLKYLGT